MKITIYGGTEPREWTRFPLDWFGHPPRTHCEFAFLLADQRLRFRLKMSGSCNFDDTLPSGSFVEGLWERDVAEFFIAGCGEDYQEFNIAPSGAWWSAHFSSYRQLISPIQCSSVAVRSAAGPANWEIDFSVALSEIIPLRETSIGSARLNPTAIAFSQPREYLCLGHQSGSQPDFHLASNFLPVVYDQVAAC